MKNKEICLIGGAGFIGMHFLESFNGMNVTIIDVFEKEKFQKTSDKLEYYNYNQSGFQIIKDKKFDYIYFGKIYQSISLLIQHHSEEKVPKRNHLLLFDELDQHKQVLY